MKVRNIFSIIIFVVLMASISYAHPDFTNNANSFRVNVGNTLSFQLNSTGADNGTTVVFGKNSALGNLNSSGYFTFTPIASNAGINNVRFNVSDQNSTDELNVAINVTNINTAIRFPSEINFGGDNQEREETITATFRINNTGTTQLNNIAVSFRQTLTDKTYNFGTNITGVPSTLDPGQESGIITMKIYVPKNLDAGRRKIGELVFTSTEYTPSEYATINMEAENMLKIDQVDIEINGDVDNDIDDGDEFDVKRNDDITLTVIVKNIFDDVARIDINDVRVEVDSSALGIDERSSRIDIGYEDEDEFSVDFTIDDDEDDGVETVYITAEGVDENGAKHTAEFEFDLNVEVKSRELLITKAIFSPTSICRDATSARLNINIENSGTNDLTRAQVFVEGDNFAYSKKISDISLNDGKSRDLAFEISIPSNIARGNYLFNIYAYTDTGSSSKTDETVATLDIKDCSTPVTPPTTPTNQSNGGSVIVQPYQPGPGAVFGEPVSGQGFFQENTYIILLIVANVLLVVLIILLLVKRR